jgi:hypothetical protein
VTHGSLMCEIPVLEPDDELLDRLAELAAASRVSRGGVVVPVAFVGPASRAVVMAATVAAVTAGAAAAATHLSQPRHEQPAPPGVSVSIQRPESSYQHTPAATTRVPGHPAHPAQAHPASVTDHHAPPIPHSTANDPAAPAPQVPTGQHTGSDTSNETGDQSGDQSGDQTGDQTGSQTGDQTGDQTGTDGSGTGSSGGSDGDTGGDDVGATLSSTSDGGGQDGGGMQAGSDGGSSVGSGRDPSSVLNGPSD